MLRTYLLTLSCLDWKQDFHLTSFNTWPHGSERDNVELQRTLWSMLRSVDGYTVSDIVYWEGLSLRLPIIASLKYICNQKNIKIKLNFLDVYTYQHHRVHIYVCRDNFGKLCKVYFERWESQFIHPTTLILYT